MKPEQKRDFDKEAAQWDANPGRVKLANEVADAIIKEAGLTREMTALDFGCGTGLVTLRLQPLVKSITGVDSSPGMINALEEKIEAQKLSNVHAQYVDFEKDGRIDGQFHLIVSSMVLHHVHDSAALFRQWYGLLLSGGELCFSDLDSEDGSFHGDNTGVFHLGFDRSYLKELLQKTGFRDIRDLTATTMTKDVEGKGKYGFPVFLILAKK